jgi:hypothetical protein
MNLRGQLESDGQYTIGGAPLTLLPSWPTSAGIKAGGCSVLIQVASLSLDRAPVLSLRSEPPPAILRSIGRAHRPFNWTLAGVSARSDAGRQGLEAAAQRITQQSPPPVRLSDTFVATLIDSAEVFDLRQVAAGLTRHHVLMVGARQDATAPMSTHFEPVVGALHSAQAVVRDTVFDDGHNLTNTLPAVFAFFARWASDCAR